MEYVVKGYGPEDWDDKPPNMFKCCGRWYVNPLPSSYGSSTPTTFDDVFRSYGVTKWNHSMLLLTNKHPALGRVSGDIPGLFLWDVRPSNMPIEDDDYHTDFGEGGWGTKSI